MGFVESLHALAEVLKFVSHNSFTLQLHCKERPCMLDLRFSVVITYDFNSLIMYLVYILRHTCHNYNNYMHSSFILGREMVELFLSSV